MNEFTKEELIELWEYCNWEPPAPGHSDFRQNLWLKLQYMINNYCEHEPSDAHLMTWKYHLCKKCGAEFKSEHEQCEVYEELKS